VFWIFLYIFIYNSKIIKGGIMINKKLNLEELKVRSFVTSLNRSEKSGVKGGAYTQAPCVPPTIVEPPSESLDVWCMVTDQNCNSGYWCNYPY
jgi:hypothetical protein